jgi:hypothetical protein
VRSTLSPFLALILIEQFSISLALDIYPANQGQFSTRALRSVASGQNGLHRGNRASLTALPFSAGR